MCLSQLGTVPIHGRNLVLWTCVENMGLALTCWKGGDGDF